LAAGADVFETAHDAMSHTAVAANNKVLNGAFIVTSILVIVYFYLPLRTKMRSDTLTNLVPKLPII
jgi:hypothetical membrane protein